MCLYYSPSHVNLIITKNSQIEKCFMRLIVSGLVIHSVLLILLWMNLNDVQERKTSSRDFFFLYHLYIKYKTSDMFEETSSEMQMCLISLRKFGLQYWIWRKRKYLSF